MGQDLIKKDISRCMNKNCERRNECKRFLQVEIDRKGTDGLVSVTNFEEKDCENFIENK